MQGYDQAERRPATRPYEKHIDCPARDSALIIGRGTQPPSTWSTDMCIQQHEALCTVMTAPSRTVGLLYLGRPDLSFDPTRQRGTFGAVSQCF